MVAFLRVLFASMVRLLRLPLDLLFLGYDTLRILLWVLLVRPVLRRRNPSRRHPSPQLCSLSQLHCGPREGPRLCGPARKYGSPWLYSVLCAWCQICRTPGAAGTTAVCERSEAFTVSPIRLGLVGVNLLAVYLVVGAAVGWTARRATRTRYWPAVITALPAPRATRATAATPTPDAGEGTRQRIQAIVHLQTARQLTASGRTADARVAFQAAADLDATNLEAQMGLAESALALDLRTDAELALECALRLRADYAPAHLLLARLERTSGRLDAALEHAERALAANPQSLEARLELGHCHLAAGHYDDAAEQAEAASAQTPREPGARLLLAEVALARRNLSDAERLYRQTLDLDPDLAAAKMGMARLLRWRGEYSAAISQVNDVLAQTPDSTEATLELVEVHVARGKSTTAISMLRALRTRQPGFYAGRLRLAELLVAAGQANAGYVVAQEVLADDPGNCPAHIILADTFLRNGFPTLASEHCRRALAQNPGRVMVIKLLVRAYLAAGDYPNAAVEVRRLLEQRPADLEAQVMLAYCHEGMRKGEEAVATLEAAAAAFPASAVPLSELGALHLRRGDPTAAARCYDRALTRAPDDPLVLNNRAALMLDNGADKGPAIEMAQRASTLLPGNPAVADTLGWAYCQRGEFDRAAEYLVVAALQMRQNPTVRYHLASALYGKGEVAKARDLLKQALAMGPEFGAAAAATALLEKIRAEHREEPGLEQP